jgi:hypothetical protein
VPNSALFPPLDAILPHLAGLTHGYFGQLHAARSASPIGYAAQDSWWCLPRSPGCWGWSVLPVLLSVSLSRSRIGLRGILSRLSGGFRSASTAVSKPLSASAWRPEGAGDDGGPAVFSNG